MHANKRGREKVQKSANSLCSLSQGSNAVTEIYPCNSGAIFDAPIAVRQLTFDMYKEPTPSIHSHIFGLHNFTGSFKGMWT